MPERVVIVGAGAAGVRAAERLRELGFTGELTIVGEEPYRPYHRPALSKELITGRLRPRDLRLPVHRELGATWRFSTRAVYLEPEEHLLHLPGGEEIRYDGLVIATGMQARHLPGAPRHNARVHVLRGIADAVSIQQTLTRGKGALAIIGGGFVASELASSARALGRDATIILRDRSLMANVPGTDFSRTIGALHEANGVQIVTDAYVSHWVPQHQGIAMHLNTGQVVVAACVVLGVGTVPAVAWLRGSGLIIDDGVMCGPTCHAIGASDIVVAGDVARWPNLRFDSVPRRVEHWQNAIEMGRAAAENLLLGQASAKPYTPLPRFWTEQHGLRIQAAGTPALAQDTVALDGSRNVGHRITGYLSNGNLVGVVGWDSPAGMLKWTAELEKQSGEAMRERMGRPARRRPAIRALGPATRRRELPPASSSQTGTSPALRALPPARAPISPTASSPGMVPVRPMDSSPNMVPVRATASSPGMAPASAHMAPLPPTASSSRMAPVSPTASSRGMAPVPPTASSPGMAPVRPGTTSPGMAPLHPTASSPGMPRVHPTASSSRMAPVHPYASSPGMAPVPPTASSSRMAPVSPTASSPGMAPVPPTASSSRMAPVRPTDSSPGMATVQRAPMPPTASSSRMAPVRPFDSSPGMPPVHPSRMAPVHTTSPNLPPLDSSPGMPPVRPGTTSPGMVPVHVTSSSPGRSHTPPAPPTSSSPARHRASRRAPVPPTFSSPGVGPAAAATASSPAMRPASASTRFIPPTSSSAGMPPVPPPMRPALPSAQFIPPTASSPGMRPVPPTASSPGRYPASPTTSSPEMPAVPAPMDESRWAELPPTSG
jgi:NADPH-dependent 2,4-dienoyl-CoA reductase/sulfur reductase-like enzyme